MKYESDCLNVYVGKRCESKLRVHADTIDELKKRIDEADARAVSLGYKSEVYVITCEEFYTWRDDDGMLVKRETYENVVEVYKPKGDNND